jgi:murein endopeptidase
VPLKFPCWTSRLRARGPSKTVTKGHFLGWKRFPARHRLGILATLRRLRALLSILAVGALASVASSLEPSMASPHRGYAPASLFAVKSAAAHSTSVVEATVEGPSTPPAPAVTPATEPVLAAVGDPMTAPSLAAPVEDPLEEPAVDAAVVDAAELDEVRWSVERRMRLDEMATNWGMWVDDLRELNPELEDVEWVEAASSYVVYRRDPRRPTQSVGAPNRGHLLAGIPMPEGPHWRLREHRPRAFGSTTTIAALLEAMRAYGAADPDAPPLRIGEISRRAGGRIAPHVSHRSGRDVDIGYVMKVNPSENERFWRTADAKNVDAPRTWAFLQALIATGEVQQIFISAKLQPILAREAAKTLSREEVALIFSAMNPDPNVHTIVKHESGHRDHMHVRFGCERGNVRCRAQSR